MMTMVLSGGAIFAPILELLGKFSLVTHPTSLLFAFNIDKLVGIHADQYLHSPYHTADLLLANSDDATRVSFYHASG